jgi:predicted RNA-binding protein
VGFGLVKRLFRSDDEILGFDKSTHKIELAVIKYFRTPVIASEVDGLSFIKDKKNVSSYFKSEYREILETDFKRVFRKSTSTDAFPTYFETISFNYDEFILNSISGLYEVLQETQNLNQIEIKEFIKLLHALIKSQGITKSLTEINNFYRYNVWKVGIVHTTSRDPKKFVQLFDSRGNDNQLAYIKLR